MHINQDYIYMQRVLDLAKKGRGHVSPNPRVGAVIVSTSGDVIGEGYHVHYGGPHAEAVALKTCKGKSTKGTTLYVNLEPCCFQGKTPACTDAIVRAGITRVVAATKDPHPKVNGAGFDILRKNGIEIEVGVLADKARYLNRGFFSRTELGRAWCAVKIALSIDGKMANPDGESKWITGAEARKLAHALRADHDAVLVGGNTVKNDNPELTVRSVRGVNPVRLILSSKTGISKETKLFKTSSMVRTIQITDDEKESADQEMSSIEYLRIEQGNSGVIDPLEILQRLPDFGVLSVLIEGGSKVLSSFMKADVIDEISVGIAPSIVGRGIAPFDDFLPDNWDGRPRFVAGAVKKYGKDVVISYRRESSPFSQA